MSTAAGKRRRWPWAVATLAAMALLAWLWLAQHAAFGAPPGAQARAQLQASPQWRQGRFHNREPMWLDNWGGIAGLLRSDPDERPRTPLPLPASDHGQRFVQPPQSGLRVTWFGHSSTLLELDGQVLLIDPIWSERSSPVQWLGPRRWYRPPLVLAELPRVDAVVISHDHYDHLDMRSIRALDQPGTRFVVPLGVGAHLRRWGVAAASIIELDWWQHTDLGQVRITATPARHASGRLAPDSGHTLWAGYAFNGPQHRVWYSGDTGYHSDLARIGQQLGPFDLTLVEVGQYDAHWPDWHLGPELAVAAHHQVGGRILLPVHWGLFKLAHHGWTEPAERTLAAARCQATALVLPRPGQSIEPTLADADAARPWWPATPWKHAAQAPIIATVGGDRRQRVSIPSCRQDTQ